MTQAASANYTGLSVVSSLGAANGRITYRVYANFTDAQDYVTVVYGNAASHMQIQSRTTSDSGVGGAFFNPANTNTAPTAVQVFGGVDANTNVIAPVVGAAFETFCTIGVANSGQAVGGSDQTATAPNSPAWLPFLTNTTFDSANAGWFTAGPVEQGRAGYTGDQDLGLRVLIMQLTVTSTSAVKGTVNVGGINNVALAGQQSFDLSGQTFRGGFIIPAPGAMALLGLAGLVGSRRRRA
jgi:uncharacterized protein (TIGR03382 family)